jgi:hypothetical protein
LLDFLYGVAKSPVAEGLAGLLDKTENPSIKNSFEPKMRSSLEQG